RGSLSSFPIATLMTSFTASLTRRILSLDIGTATAHLLSPRLGSTISHLVPATDRKNPIEPLAPLKQDLQTTPAGARYADPPESAPRGTAQAPIRPVRARAPT